MRIFTFMRPLYSDVFPEYKDDGLKKRLGGNPNWETAIKSKGVHQYI